MGFLEYAWSLFFDKDWMKNKVLISSKFRFPQFRQTEGCSICTFPEPTALEGEEEALSLMGYIFPDDTLGQCQLASLFRASVIYLSSLSINANFEDYVEWARGKNQRLANFVSSIIEGIKAITYISLKQQDKLLDLAVANTLALRRFSKIDGYINPATKIMAGFLIKAHTGINLIHSRHESEVVENLYILVQRFRDKVVSSFSEKNLNLKEEKLKLADEIYQVIENAGVITETPFLPHTQELGPCSVFRPNLYVNFDVTLDENFKNCLEFLGVNLESFRGSSQKWRKIAENEGLQLIDTWKHQKEKDEKLLSQYQNILSLTKFKSVEIPEQDYTEFLKIKARCKTEAHRLIESLLVARDALDEDPRKLYGVLDLQEVIQVVAGRSPRTDVFMLDENISKSYSWIILLDVSESMKSVSDFAMEIFLIMAEAANELLLDPTSWAMYAFNDRFFVIKDLKERYNIRVKSRIGGIKFGGLTYIPDALTVTGEVMKARNDKLRLITVISDGWPYGYPSIDIALTEIVNALKSRDISPVGIGAKSTRIGSYFKSNCSAFTLRDLTKQFSRIFIEASNIAVET
ncbi:MAG: hypothetical protein QXL24_06115 [Candidatus Jordarchaeaceae archaeon]